MNQSFVARNQRLFRIVAVILAIYTLIEVTDCITIILMHFGVVANHYPPILWPEYDALFNQQPIALFPVFLYFTSLRGLSAFGLFRKRVWGFWAAILVCVTTILWVPFLMPFAGFEMVLDGVIVFLLLVAYFGKQSLELSE